MPFEKKELSRPFGAGRITATLDMGNGRGDRAAQTLEFEVWVMNHSVGVPVLLVNPSLDVTLYRRIGASGWDQRTPIRLPLSTGDLGTTGGILSNEAMIWRPFAYLPAELLLRIDALRHVEYGLKAEFKISAGLVPLAGAPGGASSTTPFGDTRFIWQGDFAITGDLWRELLAAMRWPTPRVFELHPLSFSTLEEFEQAAVKLKEAERQMFLGHWGESVALSRIVVEAVFRKLGYKDKKPFDWKSIVAAGLPAEMSDLFKALNSVANHEHHPTGLDPQWERADARFMLQVAAALAEYAGTLPPRTVPAS